MEIEDKSYGGVTKVTLHKDDKCLWGKELNKWIRKSIPVINRKIILNCRNQGLCNSEVYIIFQQVYSTLPTLNHILVITEFRGQEKNSLGIQRWIVIT